MRYFSFLIVFTFFLSVEFGFAISFTFVGDIMCGSDYPSPQNVPFKPSQFFKSVTPYLSQADLTLGNLEGVIADKNTKIRYKGKRVYYFRMPPYTAKMLKSSGFNILNLANNHSYDFGKKGLEQTIDYLKKQNINTVGIKGKSFKTNFGPTNIHILGFSTYYYHDSILDLKSVSEVIKQNADCDILIVTFHGGGEGEKSSLIPKTNEYYYGEPRGDVYRFARLAIDLGADLVIGHGPHVLRGMEWYKGRLIAYSLGNFSGYKLFSVRGYKGISVILNVEVNKKGKFVGGQIHSIDLKPLGQPVPDFQNRGLKKIVSLSQKNFSNNRLRFSTDGKIYLKKRKP